MENTKWEFNRRRQIGLALACAGSLIAAASGSFEAMIGVIVVGIAAPIYFS